MKQLLQSLKTGDTEIVDVPCPRITRGCLLIRTHYSMVSSGTERMLIEFAQAGLLEKARQQPEKVRAVLDKVKADGIAVTLDAVRDKLDQPLPMGYCNVGEVIEVSPGLNGFAVGDRVVSNGPHAEVVCVPKNLCAKIPDTVEDDVAVFTIVGAIALQGMRLAQPSLGEAFVVMGLGIIGLLAVQLLLAQGCRVLGVDPDPRRRALARQCGAEVVDLPGGEDPVSVATVFSRGRGVDGVLITASTKSSEPIHQAALMCRKRGRIILVGMAGLELSRADFYEKELTFQVSCSYGPGRYDPAYEEGGHDYPFGYVRWTEQRNFEAILDMFADARLCVRQLVTHRFPFEKAKEAYSLLTSSEPSLGILLQYLEGQEHQAAEELLEKTVSLQRAPVYVRSCARSMPVVGVIGAGNYATRVLLPALKKTGVVLKTVVSSRGVSGIHAGRKFGFQETTTDSTRVFADKEIDAVVIATRHDSHAYFVCQALAAGKHVFVEKPLALNSKELDAIEASYSSRTHSQLVLMVGFNRRFAPQTQKMKMLLESIQEPISFIMTVNAGWLPADHWTQDPYLGGGRIIGEGCHFIDLLRFLAGHPITMVQATRLGDASSVNGQGDTASFVLQFTNGSFGVVHYLANGHRAFPKERLEVFCAGRVLRLNNFRRMRGYGWPGFKRMNLWRQDKGHTTEIATFVRAIQQGSPSPIPFGELVEVSRATFQVAELS